MIIAAVVRAIAAFLRRSKNQGGGSSGTTPAGIDQPLDRREQRRDDRL